MGDFDVFTGNTQPDADIGLPELDLDFSRDEVLTYEPLDEGTYRVYLFSSEIASNKAGTGINWIKQFKFPSDHPKYPDRSTRKVYTSLSSENGRGILVKRYEALTDKEWQPIKNSDEFLRELVSLQGRMVDIIVGHKPHYEPARAARGEKQDEILDMVAPEGMDGDYSPSPGNII